MTELATNNNSTAIVALVKAQQEMGKALKSSKNPHYKSKYADLPSVMDACVPALNNNGFAVLQPIGQDESGGIYVDTVLAHSSGEKFVSRVYLVVDKNNMQGVGSATTYARRYGLMGLAGIAPEDDDGNAAVSAPPVQRNSFNDEAEFNHILKAVKGAKSLDGLKSIWKSRLEMINKIKASRPDLFSKLDSAKEAQKTNLSTPQFDDEIPF